MEITYFGLNAVRLRGREATVMIDPYEPKLGLAPVRLNVQIVIFTHEDPTHFSMQGLAGDPHVVTGAGEFEIKAVAMSGTQTYHDAKQGAERGKNFIYTVELDDLRWLAVLRFFLRHGRFLVRMLLCLMTVRRPAPFRRRGLAGRRWALCAE